MWAEEGSGDLMLVAMEVVQAQHSPCSGEEAAQHHETEVEVEQALRYLCLVVAEALDLG